jgi:hypothetical protein
MAGYSYTSTGYNFTGNGTNITPERWFPRLLQTLKTPPALWLQFAQPAIDGEQFFKLNAGDTIRVNARSQIAPASTALTHGTPIALTNQTTEQASITIAEYGAGLDYANIQRLLTDLPLLETIAGDLAENAVWTMSAVVGSTIMGGTNYFMVGGTTGTLFSSGAGGGSWYVKPQHVRWLSAYADRLGLPRFADGYFHMVGPAGWAHSLLASSEVIDNLSRLGDNAIRTGAIGELYGVVLHNETGASSVLTHTGAAEGTIAFLAADPVIGGNNVNRPDLLTYYTDPQNDAGRQGKVLWYALAGYALRNNTAATASMFRVLCAMGE